MGEVLFHGKGRKYRHMMPIEEGRVFGRCATFSLIFELMKKLLVYSAMVVLMALSACKIKAPVVSDFKTTDVKKNESGKTGIELQVHIKNPNAFALRIKRLNFEVYMNDKVLGTAYSNKKIKIARKSDGTHTVFLETDINQMKTIMTSLGAFFTQKSEFGLRGNVKCSAGIIPKRFKVDVKTKVNITDLF
jgi:LEA14-like dessication related protein